MFRTRFALLLVAVLWSENGFRSVLGFVIPRAASSSRSRPVPSRHHLGAVAVVESDTPASLLYKSQTNVTLEFPPYDELMGCQVGGCFVSEPFHCGEEQFCVKLYPRGGGHNSNVGSNNNNNKKENDKSSGFGMSYQVVPPSFMRKEDEKVGLYLQYLGERETDATVDVTFALRLLGNQAYGRKFNVEWRAGMRFVSCGETKLAKGRANDFGAHLMQTPLLREFMGMEPRDEEEFVNAAQPLVAQVEVTIHDTDKESKAFSNTTMVINQQDENEEKDDDDDDDKFSFFAAWGKDIRAPANANPNKNQPLKAHDGKRVRVGKVVVPILTKLSQRPRLFEVGAYPGVEYRIMRILDSSGKERFTSAPGCQYELKPIYPLVPQLERPWPVAVQESEIPRLYTPKMYNILSALGSLATAVVGLTAAFVISQAVSLFFIPSKSMDPTLQVGDVLLVNKVTPRLLSQNRNEPPGEVVLFAPPAALGDFVATNGGGKTLTSRELFVKCVAAAGPSTVLVSREGGVLVDGRPVARPEQLCEEEPLRLIDRYLKEGKVELKKGEYFVLGDCHSVSIDSRVWGTLPAENIVGRTVARIWPLDRMGPIPKLEPLSTIQKVGDQ